MGMIHEMAWPGVACVVHGFGRYLVHVHTYIYIHIHIHIHIHIYTISDIPLILKVVVQT